MQDNKTYHLVLETRPGDFMPIDINILANNINNVFNTSLQEIDNFTKKYTEEELLKLIRDNNIVPEKYLEGTMQIINNHKYRYPVFYKDITFSIDNFLNENINNKQLMNKFLNIYLKYSKDKKESMQKAINDEDNNEILNLLSDLSYLNVRNIYFYILNNIIN